LAKGVLLFLDTFTLPAFKKGFRRVQRKYYAGGEGELMARPGKYGLCFIFIIIATVIMLFAFADMPALACVGARQMAMGGTFVGIADDLSAVYWNPAGIAMLEQRGLHITSTLNNRDTFNYDDFLVYVSPKHGDLSLGLSFIREHMGEPDCIGEYQAGNWFTCSVAALVMEGLSIGANIRYEAYSQKALCGDFASGSRWGLDLGFLCQVSSKVSLGCLIQDVGLSKVQWTDGSSEARRINVRPGIGYRPNPYTLIACDIYDFDALIASRGTYEESRLCLRLGLERWLTPNLAARFGYYGIKTREGAVTYGIGLRKGRYTLDYAYLDVATVPGHSGLGGTHQIGVTVKF
jgi:hypothetical protein